MGSRIRIKKPKGAKRRLHNRFERIRCYLLSKQALFEIGECNILIEEKLNMQLFQKPKILYHFKALFLCAVLCFSFLFSLSQKVSAEVDGYIGGNEYWYYINRHKQFNVKLSDGVSEGCWLTSSASKNTVELEIIRSGGKILEDNEYAPTIIISAIGYSTGAGTCAVYAEITVRSVQSGDLISEGRKIITGYSVTLWNLGRLLTGPKNGMSDRVKNTHLELIQGFLVNLNKNANIIEANVLKNVDDAYRDFWTNYFSK